MSLFSKRDSTIKIRTCRICLTANSVDMVFLEEENGWLKLFEFCFGFTLTSQDEPRLLCKICAEKVQSYVEFKEKCHKSHSLWKSVISDVKCYVVKHQNRENTNENADDPVTIKTQIKDETLDPHFDNDTHYSNYDDNDTHYSKRDDNDTYYSNHDDNDTYYSNHDDNDTHYSNHDDNEMVNLSSTEIKIEFHEDDINSRDDENKKKNDCLRTKPNSKQINCKSSKSNGSVKSKEKEIYTCAKCKFNYGRKHNDQNTDNVKHESEIEIIGKQDQNVSSSSCGLCNLSFATTKELCIHLNDHWSNNDLACKLCDFVGIDLAATVVHRYSHFPRNDMIRFLCHICEKNKPSLMALHFHYRREHLKKSGGYCSKCNKEYNKLQLWKKHEMTHSVRKHVCDICGRRFHFKHSIREHITNHMRLNKSVCDICGKTFARQNYLKLHKETVHCESAPLQCYHCNRRFKSQFSLNKHQKNVVTREKTLKCEVCHKAFITPNTLRLHMVMHSDVRPYSCNLCGASYKYKSNLTHHQLKHFGVFLQCSVCTRTFSTAASLKRHSSVHTGIRRHKCSVTSCTKTFYSNKLMLAHLERRHKDENVGDVMEEKIV